MEGKHLVPWRTQEGIRSLDSPLFQNMVLKIGRKALYIFSRKAFLRLCESLKGVVKNIFKVAPPDANFYGPGCVSALLPVLTIQFIFQYFPCFVHMAVLVLEMRKS